MNPGNNIDGIYMAIDYHPWSEKTIDLIARDLGIIPDNGPSAEYRGGYKYHTTICYMAFKDFGTSPQEQEKLLKFTNKNGSSIIEPAKQRRPKIQVPVKIIGFGIFDTPDGKTLYIKVQSNFLTSEYNRAKNFGIKSTYRNYVAHITLKTDVGKDFKIPKEIEQKYKNTILYSNDEYIEPINN